MWGKSQTWNNQTGEKETAWHHASVHSRHIICKRLLPLMKKGRLQQEWMPLFQQADPTESEHPGNVYTCERKGQPGGTCVCSYET